ncbi:hypothetical protein [Ferrimonas sp.]|uniref:hypothetical protein n=1 Tax=Ferrimonas sp. TaxID=2080861 RepID=UPI003A9011CD
MRKLIALAVLSAMGLAGCGSDSDSTPPPPAPEQPTPAPQYANLDVHVEPNRQFDGMVRIYLGRWYPCTTEHPEMCDPAMPADYELPTTGSQTGTYGKPKDENDRNKNKYYNARTRDDSKYYMEIAASDIKAWRAQSIRDDIFVPGQYSILDVMLYVSTIRTDLEVTLGEWNDELNTYDYSVSFDANGDGDFDDVADGDYKDSEDWYAASTYDQGDNLKIANPVLDTLYERLDEYWVQPEMNIRFQPVSPMMRERVKQMQKAEADRLKANGGKVILPSLVLAYLDGRKGPQLPASNFEVKAYNLRPDVYQPGVITIADAMMTAYHEYGVDIRFGFWPTLSTGATIDAYIITQADGVRNGSEGFSGWGWVAGEAQSALDFFNGPAWPKAQELVEGSAPYDNPTICHFLRDEHGLLTEETAQECIDMWYSAYGGINLHRTADVSVMVNPKEFVQLYWVGPDYGSKYEMTEHNIAGDGKFPIHDVAQAVAPLQSSHFGWGIADCGLCHGKENTHLDGGDSPVLGEITEPYFCASCHGGNGAPQGHGAIVRCHFCHSKDKLMLNHGEASKQYRFDEIPCFGVTQKGNELNGEMGSCADVVKSKDPYTKDMLDGYSHNGTTYGEQDPSKQLTRGNSDWHTSETFPDPYSCMTCHPNK